MGNLKFWLVAVFSICFSVNTLLYSAHAKQETSPIVSTKWLNRNLNNPDLFVLDIRSQISGVSRKTFLAGHIPGAVYSNYIRDGWRVKSSDGVPGVLPSAKQLEELFGRLGIANNSHVVIIGAGNKALDVGSATRVYWTLKMAGHSKLSILNGGYSGWVSDPLNPVETGPDKTRETVYKVSLRTDLLATKADVTAALGTSVSLIDNRPPQQFSGKISHPALRRSGTITGAVNIPEGSLTQDGRGFFKAKPELEALYSQAKVSTSGAQINFCNTGHWASLGWFVSHEILGNKEARLYDGSMVEWSADPSAPMSLKP